MSHTLAAEALAELGPAAGYLLLLAVSALLAAALHGSLHRAQSVPGIVFDAGPYGTATRYQEFSETLRLFGQTTVYCGAIMLCVAALPPGSGLVHRIQSVLISAVALAFGVMLGRAVAALLSWLSLELAGARYQRISGQTYRVNFVHADGTIVFDTTTREARLAHERNWVFERPKLIRTNLLFVTVIGVLMLAVERLVAGAGWWQVAGEAFLIPFLLALGAEPAGRLLIYAVDKYAYDRGAQYISAPRTRDGPTPRTTKDDVVAQMHTGAARYHDPFEDRT